SGIISSPPSACCRARCCTCTTASSPATSPRWPAARRSRRAPATTSCSRSAWSPRWRGRWWSRASPVGRCRTLPPRSLSHASPEDPNASSWCPRIFVVSPHQMSTQIHGECDPRFNAVREAFADGFRSRNEVGAAVAITLDGTSVVDLWARYADQARLRPWRRDTIANIYSCTKGMTALCALQLVERGLLDLDAPVATYWPEFAHAGKGRIPVRWLLSHRAGLPAVKELLPGEALYDWDAMCDALAAQSPWW